MRSRRVLLSAAFIAGASTLAACGDDGPTGVRLNPGQLLAFPSPGAISVVGDLDKDFVAERILDEVYTWDQGTDTWVYKAPGGDGGQSPAERRSLKRVKTLQREVARLEGILEDFLRFARTGELELEWTSLNDLIEQVVAFLRPEAEARGIEIETFLNSLHHDHSYVCLQKDITRTERQAIENHRSPDIMVPELGDFSDTAGLCMNLDIVVRE